MTEVPSELMDSFPRRAWSLPSSCEEVGFDEIESEGILRLGFDSAAAHSVAKILDGSARSLQSTPVGRVAEVIGSVAEDLLTPGHSLRSVALAWLPDSAELSPEMSEFVLDRMAVNWTRDQLLSTVDLDLGGSEALDGFVARTADISSRAVGASLAFHITAGTVPGVSATSMIRSLLTKTPVFLKPGAGDVALSVLIADALRTRAPFLSDAIAVVYWPGGDVAYRDTERALLEQAELVVVYGSDHAVEDVRARVPITTRVVAYHHRVSAGFLGRGALRDLDAVEQVAKDVAFAVSSFDQRGCVSPHVLFVETTDQVVVAKVTEAVAEALASAEEERPAGPTSPRVAAAIQQLRGTAEIEAASGGRLVKHGGEAPWTVVTGSPDTAFGTACGQRVVTVVPVSGFDALHSAIVPLSRHLQTLGYAGLEPGRIAEFVQVATDAGVLRVAPFVDVPFPRPAWHHDGMGPLTPLVRWIDVEGPLAQIAEKP